MPILNGFRKVDNPKPRYLETFWYRQEKGKQYTIVSLTKQQRGYSVEINRVKKTSDTQERYGFQDSEPIKEIKFRRFENKTDADEYAKNWMRRN